MYWLFASYYCPIHWLQPTDKSFLGLKFLLLWIWSSLSLNHNDVKRLFVLLTCINLSTQKNRKLLKISLTDEVKEWWFMVWLGKIKKKEKESNPMKRLIDKLGYEVSRLFSDFKLRPWLIRRSVWWLSNHYLKRCFFYVIDLWWLLIDYRNMSLRTPLEPKLETWGVEVKLLGLNHFHQSTLIDFV